MDAEMVAEHLGLGADYAAWLSSLEQLGPPDGGVQFPHGTDLTALLDKLQVDQADRPDILSVLQTPGQAPPEWWWVLERAYHVVQHDVGDPSVMRPMPLLPAALGAEGRCFWIVVFLAAVDDIRRWHREQNISEEISWETLADLGRHMRLYRQRNGVTGLDTHWWIALHFRGGLFAIGRLQFTPYHLLSGPGGPLFWYDDAAASALGDGFHRGDPAIGIHIPEAGPLTPRLCDDSFARAHAFFQQHFTEYKDAVATCTSWLLDDQLLDYLDADSNIVRFQKRFELVPGARDSDSSAFHFVFGRPPESIDELAPRTALEHAIIRHVKLGGHWRMRTGWVSLAQARE
jgi:hypothetical protein